MCLITISWYSNINNIEIFDFVAQIFNIWGMIFLNIWFIIIPDSNYYLLKIKKLIILTWILLFLKKSFNIFKKMDSNKIKNLPTTQSAEDINRRK